MDRPQGCLRGAAGGAPGRRYSGENAWSCCDSAESDVVRPQRVVILELAAAHMSEHGLKPVDVVSHPEDVEVADLVVGPTFGHRDGFELDAQRTFEPRLEPERGAGGNIDVEHAVRGADATGFFGFNVPVIQAAKIVLEEWFLRGVRCAARENQQREPASEYARGCRRAHRASDS